MMKKNKIAVLLMTIITLMGLLACPEPWESQALEYCTVSFNKNGGDSADIANLQVEKGKTMGSKYPKDPFKNSYKFDGWYDERNVKYGAYTKVTKDLNLKAYWKGLIYEVTFDKNNTDSGSTDASPLTKTVTVPSTTIDALPAAPKRFGHTFNGWNTDADGSGTAFEQTTNVSANITVYAQWMADTNANEYTVTFNKNNTDSGSTEPSPATKTVIIPATTIDALPTAPTRTGYIFNGWNTQADGKGTSFIQTTTVSTSIIVYAQWTANTLSINYAPGGSAGSVPTSPASAAYGSDVTMPQNTFTRTGYSFTGWSVSGTGSTADTHAAGASVAVSALSESIKTGNASIILTATWTSNTLSITYANGGGAGSAPASPISATYGSSVTIPANTYTRPGYSFTGWTVSGTGSVPGTYTAGTSITVTNLSTGITTGNTDITLTATWTSNTLSITYVNGGGAGSAPASPTSAAYGTNITMPANTFTRTGYTFAGWIVSGTGSVTGTHMAGASVAVSDLSTGINTGNASIILTAQWTENDTYLVTFNKNAPDATEANPLTKKITVPITTIDTLPAAPTRTGYIFNSWNTQANGSGTSFVQSTTVSASITVYAQWTANILSINYASGGGAGSAPASPTSAAYGTNVTMPANPYSKTGYTFAGWSVSGTGSTAGTHVAGASVAVSDLSTGIKNGNASITLTATWTANTLSITYANGGGAGSNPASPTSAAYGTNVTMPANPYTRTGYSFAGWSVSGTGSVSGTHVAGASVAVTALSTGINTGNASITLTAQWTANTLTITYANGGGGGSNPVSPTSAAYGTNVTMPANPYTRTGYSFAGWSVSGTGSVSGTHVAGASVAVTALSTGINTGNASITLTATWTANIYTVTFNKNNTDSGSTEPNPAATTVTVPTTTIDALPAAPTRTGYTFAGWNTQANGSGTSFFQQTTVSTSITVYAQWTANTLTITYANGGGAGSNPASPTSAAYGTNVTMPANPYTRTGYSFAGWSVSGTGSVSGTHVAGASVAVTVLSTGINTGNASITLTATWTANTLTITYANGGGGGSNPASPTSAAYGTNVTMPANPYTRTGYSFAGWSVSGTGSVSGTHVAGASVAVTALSTGINTGNASITLTATWEITKSSNANIRAVTGQATDGATPTSAAYGLYIGGVPAISNGTPGTSVTGTGAPSANGTISGSNVTQTNRDIVVIVEDASVSSVEYGYINSTTENTAPTFKSMTRNNDYAPPGLTNKIWKGTLTETYMTGERRFYVRITAEDSTTVKVYRYVLKSGSNNRGVINALTIGGQTLSEDAARGNDAGWWNKTAAPDWTPGTVTLFMGGTVTISSSFSNNGNTGFISYARVPAADWPLKEGAAPAFSTPASAGHQTAVAGSVNNVTDGDYILIRYDSGTSAANYVGYFGHYIIKVNIPPVVSVTVGPGTSYTFPKLKPGYTQQPYRTVTLSNSGNQPTGNLTVGLTGTNSGSFEFAPATNTVITNLTSGGLSVGQSVNLTVRPRIGLTAGSYSAAINVSGGNSSISANYAINVTVSNQPSAFIGVTSDVHWDRSTASTPTGQQIFEPWMTKLREQHYTNLDYMLFGGDNGSAYTTGVTHWDNIAEFIPIADSYVKSGFIRNSNIFITGNHEYQKTAGGALLDNLDKPLTLSGSSFTTVRSVAERLNYNTHFQAVPNAGDTTSDYVIYAFGTRPASTPSSSFQDFPLKCRNELEAYLKTASKTIPIIILTHFPLHRFAEDRFTEYAGEMIDLLNQYPNVIMLWGHNHSRDDAMYQTIKGPGYVMNTTAGTSKELVKKSINFLYVPMGAMRDREYKDNESWQTYNKGVVLEIDGKKLTFRYYDNQCELMTQPDYEPVAVYNLTGSGYVKQ